LLPIGGDCIASASLAKPNEEQQKRLPCNFARDQVALAPKAFGAVFSGEYDRAAMDALVDSALYNRRTPLWR